MKKLLFLSGISLFILANQAQAFETLAKNALLMDADTGFVIYEKEANIPMPPASMSKLMTAYMVFEALQNGKIKLEDEFITSENAWKKGGAKSGSSTMFLNPNERVKVKDLLRGIIVQSGNDACIVVAENMAGTEEAFAELMNEKAKELGLKNSSFRNATGLPDENHKMSAKDLAKLAQILINQFPEFYPIYSEKSFTHNGIKQGNRNPLLYTMDGADGLKTGHTEVSGYGLTGSAKTPDGRRLIMVLNGMKSMNERREESQKLMNWGAIGFENVTLIKKNQKIEEIPVWLGTKSTVQAVAATDFKVTTPKGRKVSPEMKIIYNSPVEAPVQKGQKLGTLIISTGIGNRSVELLAAESVEKVGYFGKIKHIIMSLIK